MQCDVHDMDQMSEEEILACLVADTEPVFTVRRSGLLWAGLDAPGAALVRGGSCQQLEKEPVNL